MPLTSKILSLNIGGPEQMEWQGRKILSSMLKRPTPGPLVVHLDRVDGNTFASPTVHGSSDAVLYAFGLPSAEAFVKRMGRSQYEPGSTGETLTLDELDETDVSVGDIFEIGKVVAQATFPRIPCGKVDIRMEHAGGRQAMVDCGRSGVYFRILNPGLIHQTDLVKRTERSKHPFMISRLYEIITGNQLPKDGEFEMALQNPAFVQNIIQKWEAKRAAAP